MNLNQYLSLLCFVQPAPGPTAPAPAAISQEEKFYHYQVLKRWTQQHEKQNSIVSKHCQCDCLPEMQLGRSCVNLEDSQSLEISLAAERENQKSTQIQKSRTINDENLIVIAFLKRLKYEFQSNKNGLKIMFGKLNIDISLKEFKKWLLQHSPQSYGLRQLEYIKNLINCCDHKSLIIRVMLKKFMRNQSRLCTLRRGRWTKQRMGFLRAVQKDLLRGSD